MKIDGCVPCFNNANTVGLAVKSLQAQTVPVTDAFVIDDGSTDGTGDAARATGARVIRFESNRGRGAARAAAFRETHADLLLSVDGTGELAPDFLAHALPWFEDDKVAAVYGRITQGGSRTIAERWRGRHLYKTGEIQHPGLVDSLITWAFVARAAAVREVGNFNQDLRHSEDLELGERLIAAGWRIVYEPRATVMTSGSNTIAEVFERYWRWNSGLHPRFRAAGYLKNVAYAIKVLAKRDLAARDPACAVLSLALPHYCAIRTLTTGKP
jgi:cellulose synthase/poly-beta-1,6-N-acetylglucosamine synthase-like glycosyltransferase